MKPHPQTTPPSFPVPSMSHRPGQTQKPKAWNWHLNPKLWARSVRQQLNTCLRFILEEKTNPWFDTFQSGLAGCSCSGQGHSWDCQKKQEGFKAVLESEQRAMLKLLLSELRSLFSAVLQDGSCEAWRYLHAVLGLLPPYREMLAGQLELLPFLEQLYCWAPKVQTWLQMDLLDAIDKAFPPDSSLLHRSSHVGCGPWMKRFHRGPPYSACPFVKARWDQQQKKELATWLRPLTLPELQHCLGIVGAEVALEETPWLDSLSLLPLALATDIPVQYESNDIEHAEGEPAGRKPQLASEAPEEKALKKKSSRTPVLRSQVKSLLKRDWSQKKIHFLYLNVASDRHFNPYKLVAVPPDKVNPEHYIFSPFGILHVHPVEGNEAMTLGTWHRDYGLWRELQRIPFFKNCLLRKALTCWKKNVRLRGLNRIQTFLKTHLLLAIPHFGAGMLHISRLLQEFRSVSWLPKEPDRCYELVDLQKAIAKENHKALRVFSHFLNLCTSILQLIHEDTYQMQQGLQERVENWNRLRKGQGSIYLQRMLCRQLEKKLKQAETWLLKLGKFARLIDYMICQNLVSILEDEISSFIANTLQAPRQKPFLLSQLVFDDNGLLSPMPGVESIIQILVKSMQSVKTSALKVVQSTDLRTSRDPMYSEDNKDQDSITEFPMPKFHGKPSDAVRLFCGPNVGYVWPWKSHAITDVLEVRGHKLRGQYLHPNYEHVKEDLDKNAGIQQALAVQQTLLEDMRQEVQGFCNKHKWVEGIYEFLKAWNSQKLENLKGSPISDYVKLVRQLKKWQEHVSKMSVELLTKGKLLLLSGHDVQQELESKLNNLRKNILDQAQNECWSRNKQLITKLTRFLRAFQATDSDTHAIAQCSQKLNEANEHYCQLEEQVEYVRSLHDLIRNHCVLFIAENETLDIALLDLWEAFQFERSQVSEFLLSKRHAIVPRLQQLMAAALAELEGLLAKALSGPFMDPSQEQRSTEQQLGALEQQFLNILNNFNALCNAYRTFTGHETPMSLPACGNRPIVLQQRIWRLYRIISENFSEWKCVAFSKFNLPMAREKTDAWLTEAARLGSALGQQSPVLQRCMRMLDEFRAYLPLLIKLGSLQMKDVNTQSLLRALGLGGLRSLDLLTLGQLLNCPLLEFADRINQVWQYDKERIHAREILQQMQQFWEGLQLRLLNFILHVPYKPPTSERSKKPALRSPQWELVGMDSGTFLLSNYSSLQEAIQNSLQALFKILAIQKSGQLHKIALEWVSTMYGLGALLEVWVAFQQKWIFLNKVLHEMKIEFPAAELNTRFKVIDDQYRTLMRISVADPMVLSLIVPNTKRSPYFQGQHLQQLLKAGSGELEAIIMGLEDVLYGVCAKFPRLFFLSDSELVALLAAPLDTCEAQPWAQRCFPNIKAVNFRSKSTKKKSNNEDSSSSPETVETIAVLGAYGEVVKLQEPLPLHPDLPKWLASLETSLRFEIVNLLQSCVATRLAQGPSLIKTSKAMPQQRQMPMQLYVQHWLEAVQVFPWQCILVAEEVVWRAEMEEALLESRTMSMSSIYVQNLEVLVQFIQSQRHSHGEQPLPSVRQTSLFSTLLVKAVTHRDIAQLLLKNQVSDLTDFHWVRQIKYHLGSSHLNLKSPLQCLTTIASTEPSVSPAACWIDVLSRSFMYNYEYMGPKLGFLPSLLHERQVFTLLLALDEVAYGALLGRDGLGKAETVNSLAWTLGHHLVVMPCLPQIEFRCLRNYLNGALQGGAWLLLENVNQLPSSLLSALGQRLDELHHLYAPLYQKASKNISTINPTNPLLLGAGFFEKRQVSMRLGFGCFLTFQSLGPDVPANLHLLLRPVALALPNLQRVAELNLLGAGVRDASRLATRLSKLFSLERELVSGNLPCRLPLLKWVLEHTIQTLNTSEEEDKFQQPHDLAASEEAALLRALLHSPLFSILDGLRLQKLQELLCGIFPNSSHVLAEPVSHRLMKSIVVEELQHLGLFPTPNTLTSLEQLSQALSRTSGILLLGPAGSGKSTCWRSLFKIQNRLAAMEHTSTKGFQSVEIVHLYPSVLNSQEYLGWSEGPSWHYGIFPKLLHAAPYCKSLGSEEPSEKFTGIQQWIICDGAPNHEWIDSVTCLLSDPPQLSLPNGQQIARPLGTFFLIEVAEAAGMSPTVLGQCALVWCSGEQTWKSMLSVLMASLPHEYHLQQETITDLNYLVEVLVPSVLRFLTRIGASSQLQVHGHQAVCPGVAEVTSLVRILRALLDPYLHLFEEEKSHTKEDFSGSDLVTQNFKSSRSKVQSDHVSVNKKQRRHLLAISGFLFAIIWGFGAHLPSRYWPLFDDFMRKSISSLSNYPEPPPSALVFDLHINFEDGTLVPFTGHYLSTHVKGNLGSFQPSSQTEQLLYVVDLLLSNGQPVLLAGEIATGKSAFVEVLVEPNHPTIHSPIHPALNSTHLRHLLSRGVHGQTQVGSLLGHHQDSKGSILFLMEDLHLAAFDPEKSCQPVLETLRQAMEGTIYAHNTLELQTLQTAVNFLATATVPGYSERPLCPRLYRLFTVLALNSMTQDTLLSRHVPSIQAWLERFPSVEREHTLARALVKASVEAWEAVCNCFMPSPLRPHYRFSPHSVSHILGSLQLLPTRMGSRGFAEAFHHQEHLRRVSGLRGTRLTIMMSMRVMVRLWLHEAQRTFCDRLDSDRERSHCAKLLLKVAQNVFCGGPGSESLAKDSEEEEVEEEKVPEVESEEEIAQWETLSNSDSGSEEEEDPFGLQATTGSFLSDSSLAPFPIKSVNKENTENVSQMAEQEEDIRDSSSKLQSETPKREWQKAPQKDLSLPLLLPVLMFYPQESPSDLVFSLELTLGSNFESPNLYLERQWENLEKQLAASAVRLKMNSSFSQCHMMVQHVARLVRVLARPRQHALLLSEFRGTGRNTAIILASSIFQAHLFHLPFESEEGIFQCLRDASWHAGVLNQPVALLVPDEVNVATFCRLLALATSGSFPDQYTEADLDKIEEHLPKENFMIKYIIKKDAVLNRFYQQVCNNLHMFFLVGDNKAQNQLPSTLFLSLLQLTIASVERYEPWDQASLVRIAQFHLESDQGLPVDDGSLKCPDFKILIPNVANIMARIHVSSACYHQHMCPALPLVTPKTFQDFLDMFLQQQQQMILQMRMRASRIQSALKTLRLLVERHSNQTNMLTDLEKQLKGSYKNVGMYQSQLEQSKILYKQKMAECQHQESLIENLVRQHDALKAQQEAFLEQMGKAFIGPLSQLQVADFEEIRSYRAPPESVVKVTDALCDLFHRETGWSNAKQLLCTEDFYQELVFFPKEKLTDSELVKLNQALRAPGMSDAALRSVSIPAANLAVWLWAVLRYGLAQRRGLPTGLLLRQIDATLAREQTRLGQFQFQAHDLLEQTLSLAKKLEDAQVIHNHVVETLNQAQCGHFHKWPMKSALLTPMHMWTTQLQKLKEHAKTVFGDALLCSAAIIYLGPFPPRRRQELLGKWLSLCQGFEEALDPDDVAQALRQKSVGVPKNPVLPTSTPFRILTLLSCGSEQRQWDRDLKPQAKSARLLGLLLRSHIHFSSSRWPLLIDPSNQAVIWLNPLPPKQNKSLEPSPKECRAKYPVTNQDSEDETEDELEDENNEDEDETNEQRKEQKAEENKSEEENKQREQETEKENKPENSSSGSSSSPPSETPSLPSCLTVLSGTDPELGPQLLEAAANGLPVLLTNMELSLGCQELQWLLSKKNLTPPDVQPGFCLFLSTTFPIHALNRGYDLLKGLNVLDLGLNMEILEEQMLHEILCRERPELETRWQDLKIRAADTYEVMKADEEQLLAILLRQNQQHQKQKRQKPSKLLREMVRTQAKLCQLNAQMEELNEQKLEVVALWAPYRQVAYHGMVVIEALSSLQNLLPSFCMTSENWLAVIRQAIESMKPYDSNRGEDLPSHLLRLKIHLARQLLTNTVVALSLLQTPLVGAFGALAMLQVTKLERLALWPGLSASPSSGHNTQIPGVLRPTWLSSRAWEECGALELLPPFSGLRASLAGHSDVWQDYLSLSSTVLGPAPSPNSEPLSLFQKLILWRVLRPDCLAGALADLTTSLLGRPLDEDLGAPTMIFEHIQPTQPILILLPPPGHPTATLHPVTVIRKLAANHKKKHLHVIALGSEDWDPVSTIVNTLCQAMLQGHWLVLDNCHLMPFWPRELLQPLQGLLDGAKVVSDSELLAEPESTSVATVHRDFRLWLIAPTEASTSLPGVLTQRAKPVFWNQSLELGRILIDSVDSQQGLSTQPFTQTLPLFFLHGLLVHRQLYGLKLQAHRGRWSQVTLTRVLQIQEQLWASLRNPSAALLELAASVLYGDSLGDTEDKEALVSLIGTCLKPRNMNWVQPHTPQYLLATLMPSPELGELDARTDCKAQIHLLPTPPEPRTCGLNEAPQAWLLRRQSRALLNALQKCSSTWVPTVCGGTAQSKERRLRQRLVQAKKRLVALQALLTNNRFRSGQCATPWAVLGPNARRPVEGFLETEVLELKNLVGTLLRDLDCLLQQLKGGTPCTSIRCAKVAQALWAGRLPQPWRSHAPAGPQLPWLWLRQLSRRGHLLIQYLDSGMSENANEPERIFHLSAFRHPRRLLLALRWEAVLECSVHSPNLPGHQGSSSGSLPLKRQELNHYPLHIRVENGPNPKAPKMGLLLIGLQLQHAEWDQTDGALQDSFSSQPCPLPPVSVSTQARGWKDVPVSADLGMYSCPVYMTGPLGTTKLHSKNILMHLPLPTRLSLDTCIQRRVHVCSPTLT